MDLYTAALNKLRQDSRSAKEISLAMGEKVKGRALHAIRKGDAKLDNVRWGTVKHIAKLYFPKQVSA